MNIYVIGGGAAGFFTAINIAQKHPAYQVILLEKSGKLLQKVKVSGGGRCNVTNYRSSPSELVAFYPRGHKKLHGLFKKFTTTDMVDWLSQRGVETKHEEDQRMFPVTDSSQTIIDCFMEEAKKFGVKVQCNEPLVKLNSTPTGWEIITRSNVYQADKVVVASGSSPATLQILNELGLSLSSQVPSLFTFNIQDDRLKDLQGISFDHSHVRIVGTKLNDDGPLLITHWGLSGPAILKLSSIGAYELYSKDYQFEVLINFTDKQHPDEVKTHINQYQATNPKRKVANYPLFNIPRRFWNRMMEWCGISADIPYMELPKKVKNKLIEELSQGRYGVTGKSTFKEEFVTAGGVKLSEVNPDTFECKRYPNLYLAGEVLDIDALTGGFNFQACWSVGWVISESV